MGGANGRGSGRSWHRKQSGSYQEGGGSRSVDQQGGAESEGQGASSDEDGDDDDDDDVSVITADEVRDGQGLVCVAKIEAADDDPMMMSRLMWLVTSTSAGMWLVTRTSAGVWL